MARKVKSFKLDEKNKIIIIYTNVEPSPAEVELKNYYLDNNYKPMLDEKKPSLTIAQMRKELKADEKAAAEFEAAYKEKNGFFNACKIYTNWKKNNKKK